MADFAGLSRVSRSLDAGLGRGRRAVVVCACALICSVCTVASSDDAHASDASSYLSMLNGERVSHGLQALGWRSDLSAVAQAWSAHMAATRSLSHNPSLTSQVSNWRAVGENVGEGPTIKDLDAAFWDSTEHRANILDSGFEEIGIGSARSAGVIWITVVFRQPMQSSAPAVAPTSAPAVTAGGAIPAAPMSSPPGPRLVLRGTVGPRVSRLQRQLHIRADGRFGRRTERAVVRFQRHHHLTVDGIVGPQTRHALRRAHRLAELVALLRRRDVSPSPDGTWSAGSTKRLDVTTA